MINERRHIDDNGFVSQYWYDADGERTVKTSGDGEQVYVNSLFSGGRTGTSKFSLYVSPYLVASQGGRYTKHIYIGSQRIVSKLGDLQSYGADPRRIPYAGSESDNITVDYKGKYQKQQQVIKDNYATFEVPYNGLDNDNYVDGDGFCCDDKSKTRSFDPTQNDNYELAQFYYHPDHLGSSSFITNLDGDVAQHIEYVPFGEVFVEERNNVWNTPYLFNAKELDEETGLYYYGARYYDSRISLWLSVDPIKEKNFASSSYTYAVNNPIKYIDPFGTDTVPSNEVWEYNLVNFRTNGHGVSEQNFIPIKGNKNVKYYELHLITSGENEGNYYAIANYGYDETNKYEQYEYLYIVGKDKVEDFRKGEIKASGISQSIIRYAINNGVDGRKRTLDNLGRGWWRIVTDPTNWIPSPLDLTRYFPKSFWKMEDALMTPQTPKTWNNFQSITKGKYTRRNYGTIENARAAKSKDYRRWKQQ